MTNLECLRSRLADMALSLTRAIEAVQALEAADPDDRAITTRQEAVLLLRADKLGNRVELLADELVLLVSELPPEPEPLPRIGILSAPGAPA